MITTFNGCYRSDIKVQPANWNTKKASTANPWRINYRFYDPAFNDNPKLKKGKQIKILGMNHMAALEERQAITRALIDREKHKLDSKGYNPIIGVYMAPPEPVVMDAAKQDLSSSTPFIQALKTIYSELTFERDTSRCIEKVLRFVEQSAILLKKDNVPLADIKARGIKLIMVNKCLILSRE